jgi:PKD repeat protein
MRAVLGDGKRVIDERNRIRRIRPKAPLKAPRDDRRMNGACLCSRIGARRGQRRCQLRVFLALLALCASVVLAVDVAQAQAVVVGAAPIWPIPADAPAGPPPIPNLPAATQAPPPGDQIADPVTAGAACGGWELQSKYGGRWPAGSSWWEYRCTSEYSFYYNPCTSGACPAFCPECYFEAETRTDYFYWNGSDAVFYGQDYFYTFYYTEVDYPPPSTTSGWWDAPSARWYRIDSTPPAPPANVAPTARFVATCSYLTCTFDPNGSTDSDSAISRFDWDFGDNSSTGGSNTNPTDNVKQHTYARSGTFTVTLTVTDDHGATATASQAVTVEAPPPPPNVTPTAAFTFSCTGLNCAFNGSGSSDSDGTVAGYSWAFGDGGTATGITPAHTYGHAGTYSVSLTVTDDRGASATVAKELAVVNLAPTATFTVSCSGLRCTFDGSGSADRDGTIASYTWDFGDGSNGSGGTTSHDYPKPGTYTLTLSVTDNDGATAVLTRRINPISLTARGYKQNGQQKVDLSWNAVAGTTFDVYRDGIKIVTVSTAGYTDTVSKAPGNYTYKVCGSSFPSCSNQVSVSF